MTAIYSLVDPITRKTRYIGKSVNPQRRLKNHIQRSKRGHTRRDRWIRSLLEQGLEPELIILETVAGENWQEREKFWIKLYRETEPELSNHTDGGDGMTIFDSESRSRLSKTRKELFLLPEFREKMLSVFHSPERCEKISKAQRGRKHSAEHVAKLPQNKPGRKLSEETKLKIKANNRGHRWSAEEIVKIRLMNIGNTYSKGKHSNVGRKQSEEEKLKKSVALKGRPKSDEWREKIRQGLLKSWALRKGEVET